MNLLVFGKWQYQYEFSSNLQRELDTDVHAHTNTHKHPNSDNQKGLAVTPRSNKYILCPKLDFLTAFSIKMNKDGFRIGKG